MIAAALVLGGVLAGQAKEKAGAISATAAKTDAVSVKPAVIDGIIDKIDATGVTVGRLFYRLKRDSIVTLNKASVNFNALKAGDKVSLKFVAAATADGVTGGNDILTIAASRVAPAALTAGSAKFTGFNLNGNPFTGANGAHCSCPGSICRCNPAGCGGDTSGCDGDHLKDTTTTK